MQFDPLSFEYDETPDIPVGDGAVGKLNFLVYAVILTACIYYLFSAWSPTDATVLPTAVEVSMRL